MVVLGCGEKIESEDGQRIGFKRGAIFFCILGFMYYWVLEGEKKKNFCFFLNDYWVLEKKKKSEFLFFFFFLNNVDVENCCASKGFGFIYILVANLHYARKVFT